ncbi:MAG: hypothetical protein M5R40_10460 [Anaerolineae bacterium]|nr:hypothetical protein [Anaerolineae bacterium]
MLKAGATEVCITPPIGVELAGYGPRLNRCATDVHDHLTAQALVLDDGARTVALITSDLNSISRTFARQVRQQVQREVGIPPECVMVSCAHVHTAPTTRRFRDWGAPDPDYVRLVARHLAGAVAASARRLKPARLSVGRGEHTHLAWNRTDLGVVDPSVEVVRINSTSGKPVALLAHYACHPVMLGPRPVISADYPGALRRFLRTKYAGVIMFANGACGDIDPVTNRDAWGQATFDDVETVGARLGEDAWAAARHADFMDDVRLLVRQTQLRLDFEMPPLEALHEQAARHRAEVRALGGEPERLQEVTGMRTPAFWLRYYRALARRIATGRQPDHIDVELQAFVIDGALALVALPVELFTGEGLSIRAASPHAHTLPVCYANGLNGFLPPRTPYDSMADAAQVTAAVYDRPPFKADVTARLVEVVAQLVGE